MFSYRKPTFAATLRSFLDADGLPFADVLPEADIKRLADEQGVHFGEADDEVYSAAVTLWAWLSQVLSGHKCCVAAVARILVLHAALGLGVPSANTGAYCKARGKLPERFLQRLTCQLGERLEDAAEPDWRWWGKRVILADGVECSLPDTPANQKEYPQSNAQKKGLGFPLIRLVVLLTFATAGLIGCAMGPYQGKETGEPALFRTLLGHLRQGDVVVADRFYCSYWLVALLQKNGIHVCFRLHQNRQYDFRRGRRLGKGDHVVQWSKPKRPKWMDKETYANLPDTLEVREVRFVIDDPGCRSKEVVVATTLLDGRTYSKSAIAELYHQRWHVELDIRSIKQTLQMDILTCKTPPMVRKEIWTHLLAYNLVRKVMAAAAQQQGKSPRRVSFAAAVQTVNAFRWVLLLSETARVVELGKVLLLAVATHGVGDRPGRHEVRKCKRRKQSLPLMSKPRSVERAALFSTKS